MITEYSGRRNALRLLLVSGVALRICTSGFLLELPARREFLHPPNPPSTSSGQALRARKSHHGKGNFHRE